MVLAAGLIPQISLRAACLPEATERCQRLSAFVCHLNPVSAGSPRTLSRLCHSAFPSASRSETLRQCKLAIPSPPDSSKVLIAYVTQQTQGHGVCHASACGFESVCASVTLLSALAHESRACHLAWIFWVTVWVRWIQSAALCKSAPTFSSHKSLLATNCHRWQPSQRKEREGRQGVRGLKKV